MARFTYILDEECTNFITKVKYLKVLAAFNVQTEKSEDEVYTIEQ